MMDPINKRRKKYKSQGDESWVLTFADLLSLMLTFFVLMFSMNHVEVTNWSRVVKTMTDEFNPNAARIVKEEMETSQNQINLSEDPGLHISYLASILKLELAEEPLLEGGRITVKFDRVIISIPATNLFGEKNTQVKQDVKVALSRFGTKLAQLKNKVIIASHTNLSPVIGGVFRSNWELSLMRAHVIAGILTETGYRNSMIILGYGESRYDEMDESWLAADKSKFAERVDLIVIDKEKKQGSFSVF